MKTRSAPMLLCLFMAAGTTSGQLKIDFSQTAGPVEAGYEAYVADHEAAATFTSQSYSAFGATITITPTWPNNPANTAMQMIDRTNRNAYEGIHTDLLIDWIGTDKRTANANPLLLTISGLPAGTYSWLSYHHDVADQTGVCAVTVTDATGSVTTTDIEMTDSEGTDLIVEFDSISTFATTIVSNGTDDVTLSFEVTSATDPVSTAFFLMNGFEMEKTTSRNVAHSPNPADGASDVPREASLSWSPGQSAAAHNVYFGTAFDDVNDADIGNPLGVVISPGQTAPTFDPPEVLEYGQTYYWRVDEVNAPPDSDVSKGDVWRFTVEPYAYVLENVTATASSSDKPSLGPENTVNGSGLDENDLHSWDAEAMWLSSRTGPQPTWIQYEFDKACKLLEMWVWNYNVEFEVVLGFGLRDVTVEYSLDGIEWMVLTDTEFARGPSAEGYAHDTVVDLQGVMAKYVRLTANTNWAGIMPQYGLSEVRFFHVPVHAREPQPQDGQIDVDLDTVLSWRPGREAAVHEVALGADRQAVADGTAPVETVTENRYHPDTLDFATTYYWKVNEVNETATPSAWEGDIWSFTTQEYLVVDDFESYNDDYENFNRIFQVWIDGAGYALPDPGHPGNGSGSLVGTDQAPWVERGIVHSGNQAMPLAYDSAIAAVSEATRTFAVPQDWTRYGLKGLTLWFYGDPSNTASQMYVQVNGRRVDYDGDAEDLLRGPWHLWYIDLADFTGVNLASVTELTIGFEGGQGLVRIDDIALSPYDRQLVTPVEPDPVNLVAHYAFEGNANDSTGAHPGTIVGSPEFIAGQVGQAMRLDGVREYVLVESSFDLPVYSAAVWLRVDGGTAERDVISVYNAAGDHGILLEVRGNGTLRFLHRAPLGGSGGTSIYTDMAYDDGAWHHATMVKSEASLALYVDGELVGSAADDVAFDAVLDKIAMGVLKDDNLARYFPGAIDEAYLYSRVLSEGEIAWLAGRRAPFDTQ